MQGSLDTGVRGRGLDGEIVRLEAQIEALAASIGGCRKVVLLSKAAMVLAGLWLLAPAAGVMRFEPIGMVTAIAAVIGGIVAFGSSTATARENEARLRAAEARRSELIDHLDLEPTASSDGHGANAGGQPRRVTSLN